MVHAINYDLRRPGQDDEGLYAAIKNCGDWWHFLDSLWLVDPRLQSEQRPPRKGGRTKELVCALYD